MWVLEDRGERLRVRETGEGCEANGVTLFKKGEILSLIERDGGVGGRRKGGRKGRRE